MLNRGFIRKSIMISNLYNYLTSYLFIPPPKFSYKAPPLRSFKPLSPVIGANIYFFTPIFFDTSVRSENTLAVNQFLRGGGIILQWM